MHLQDMSLSSVPCRRPSAMGDHVVWCSAGARLSSNVRREVVSMGEYAIGRHRSKIHKPRSRVVHVSVTMRVYERLEGMRAALQAELGPSIPVTVASVVRRILYQHASLRKLAHRHQPDPPEELEL